MLFPDQADLMAISAKLLSLLQVKNIIETIKATWPTEAFIIWQKKPV